MRNPLDALLTTQPAVVLDGALATELERRGADLCDPLWSAKYLIEQPELIRAVHLDYFKAGADVATTATYQATYEAFLRRGIGSAAATQLMVEAVALACEAREEFWNAPAGGVPTHRDLTPRGTAHRESPGHHRTHGDRLRPLVAASIGPYGAMLADGSEYRGRYTIRDEGLRDFHRPRLQALAEAGADLFAFETIPCLREALVLARLLEELPAMSAWLGFSCQDGMRNCEGEDVGACAAALQPFAQITAIGVNCTPPQYVSSLLRRMARHTDKPLLAYPNSGERYDATHKTWAGSEAAIPFADQSLSWYAAGARLIGGCCRTTPKDIAGLRHALLRPKR
ncbi:MAG: homocysteine S-methyltransferase [Pseudomonadota bacterium]|nr:homocysteine S-methyltransferase [Pseudomonadota bacterium]